MKKCATQRKLKFAQKIFVLIAVCYSSTAVLAQLGTTDQAIEMVADSTGVDARTGRVSFTNIVISQGPLNISAQKADSSALGFDNSTWVFTGNVKINGVTAAVEASEMVLEFKNKRIDQARVTGTPLRYSSTLDDQTTVIAQSARVTFFNNEISRVAMQGAPIEVSRIALPDADRTLAEALSIDYDAQSHNLKLLGDAKLSEGGNQITGNQILYNISNQQVLAAANEEGDGRVHITIQPTTDMAPGFTNDDPPPVETDQANN